MTLPFMCLALGFGSSYYPEAIQGIVLGSFWLLVGGFFLRWFLKKVQYDRWLVWYVGAGLLWRVPLAFAHLAIGYWYYGTGLDFEMYYQRTVEVGRSLLQGDLGMLLISEEEIDKGSLFVARLYSLSYFLVGESLVGQFLLSGMVGLIGSLFFVKAFQSEFPSSSREAKWLASCLFFFPSLAFWTTLIGKDSWMYFCLGAVALSLTLFMREWRVRYLLGLLVSLAFVAMIRPPVGVPITAAVGLCILLGLKSALSGKRSTMMLRPIVYACVCAFVIVGFNVVISKMGSYAHFQEDADFVDSMVGFAVDYHTGLRQDTGGRSAVKGLELNEKSVFAVTSFMPQAMGTFLFRPFLFEAHNAVAFLAAIDSTILIGLVVWRWRNLIEAARLIWSRPLVALSAASFLLLTATLSFQTNLGVIVRHRTMVLGFLLVLLAVPLKRAEAEELTHIKRELVRITRERDFLRRAAAFFARESP